MIEKIKNQILNYFNTDKNKYSIVFTLNCTGALKMVGEMFDWTEQSRFIYHLFSHNSVLGIRKYALNSNASFSTFKSTKKNFDLLFSKSGESNLFAFPAECIIFFIFFIIFYFYFYFILFIFQLIGNFTGKKISLDLINTVHNKSTEKK